MVRETQHSGQNKENRISWEIVSSERVCRSSFSRRKTSRSRRKSKYIMVVRIKRRDLGRL